MNRRQIDIRRKIIEIRNLKPSDNTISSYADFLRYKDILSAYKFNLATFCILVELAYDLWRSGEKINKASLLELISKYSGLNKHPEQVSDRTARQLFWLFRESNINGVPGYSSATIIRMQISSNKALKGIPLTNPEIAELINNIALSRHILNRILRHPTANSLITEWIKSVFYIDSYRNRRPELIGWLLDENADYVVNDQVIADDFEYFFKIDKKLVDKYKNEHSTYKSALDQKKREIEERVSNTGVRDWQDEFPAFGLIKPKLMMEQRIYNKSIEIEGDPTIILPDFENRKRDFYSRVDFYKRLTMLWGVAYSHHKTSVKLNLYKQFYTSELYPAAIKIAYRSKNVRFLEWLYNQVDKRDI